MVAVNALQGARVAACLTLVAAVTAGGAGADSLLPPPEVSARTGDSPGEIDLAWPQPTTGTGLTAYVVYRSTVEGGMETTRTVDPWTGGWTDTLRVPGVRYHYRVSAQSVDGEGPSGAPVSARAAVLPRAMDVDSDDAPDAAESFLCGSALLLTIFGDLQVLGGATGRCDSPGDYSPPQDAHPNVAAALHDSDSDLVPDAHEPRLCYAENQNFPHEGVCLGDDWGWPP